MRACTSALMISAALLLLTCAMAVSAQDVKTGDLLLTTKWSTASPRTRIYIKEPRTNRTVGSWLLPSPGSRGEVTGQSVASPDRRLVFTVTGRFTSSASTGASTVVPMLHVSVSGPQPRDRKWIKSFDLISALPKGSLFGEGCSAVSTGAISAGSLFRGQYEIFYPFVCNSKVKPNCPAEGKGAFSGVLRLNYDSAKKALTQRGRIDVLDLNACSSKAPRYIASLRAINSGLYAVVAPLSSGRSQEYKLVNLLASDKSKAIATYTDKTGRDCRPGAWSVYSLSEFVGICVPSGGKSSAPGVITVTAKRTTKGGSAPGGTFWGSSLASTSRSTYVYASTPREGTKSISWDITRYKKRSLGDKGTRVVSLNAPTTIALFP
mmetsp:Transcript_14377/g.43445  ORF Transcript_14377/g.43445 Transcript_14377/m.43445 type:complete len:378 (-) Transcript_14377:740-1873(-)